MITHLKQKRSIICESSTAECQAHSSLGSNKRRYYSKMFSDSFCGALERTWKIVPWLILSLTLFSRGENVVFRINTKETTDRHRSKNWTSFDIMKYWFSYYGISRNWNPLRMVQNNSIKSNQRKNLKKPLKKPSFSQSIVSAKINLFQDLTT